MSAWALDWMLLTACYFLKVNGVTACYFLKVNGVNCYVLLTGRGAADKHKAPLL